MVGACCWEWRAVKVRSSMLVAVVCLLRSSGCGPLVSRVHDCFGHAVWCRFGDARGRW